MLTIDKIKQSFDKAARRLDTRNKNFRKQLQQALEADENRKKLKTEYDRLASEANKQAKEIGQLYKAGKTDLAGEAKQKASELKELQKELTEKLKQAEKQLQEILLDIPNIPNELVPEGTTEAHNQLIREGGSPPKLKKNIPHWDLAEKFDIIDFDAGNKITGAGFPVFKNKGAKLQRALINMFLREAEKNGYTEYVPPLMVNEASGLGTGQLPDKEGQMYEIKNDKLYMIPTAEVPLTNLYRGEITDDSRLPLKMCGYSACFRREAGSYGKEVRGLNRLHQFDKVEIVQITKAEKSYETLDEMVAQVEALIQKLELPYRIVRLCGGDLGFTSALTYDFEVWAAGQQKWLEVSSVSNFEDYQANRLKMRYKDKSEKTKKTPHTLNGSALALPRIIAALLENNFTGDAVKIPKALQDYTHFNEIP